MTVQEILRQLVAFPIFGAKSNLPIIHWIADYLKQHEVDYTLLPNDAGDKASLHCRIGPPAEGGIILSGHTDVVPIEGQDWDTPPFELTEKEGKLYGRGACDMKGFIACCLAVLPKMLAAPLKKPIYFAFSYDEEIGCLAAEELANAFKTAYSPMPQYAIIGEPSMMEPIIGQKGIFVYVVTVYGSGGHSSRIKTEVSAVHEAARLLVWLEQKMDRLIADGNTNDLFTPNHTSLHVGMMNGGIAANVVADKCKFTLDIRNIPSDSIKELLAEFEAHTKAVEQQLQERFAGAKITIEPTASKVPAFETEEDKSIVQYIKQLTGNTKVSGVSYAAEASYFSNAGFEAVICGPGSIAQAHRANEFIDIEQLEKGEAFLERLIASLC